MGSNRGGCEGECHLGLWELGSVRGFFEELKCVGRL